MLIEKDNKPVWKHSSFKEVDVNRINRVIFDRTEEIDVKIEENVEQSAENNEEKK
jgi:hypothetical protein